MSTKPILHDHKRQGHRLIPPFVYELGNIQETSWIRTIIPEICWLALLQIEFGHQRGVEITTLLARVSRALSSEFSCIPFCSISHYAAIPDNL